MMLGSRVGTAHGLTYDLTNQIQIIFTRSSGYYFATLMLDRTDIYIITIDAVGITHTTEFTAHKPAFK